MPPLWFAVHPPQLSLEAYCAALPPALAAGPVALVADHRIAAANAAAAGCGIRPGLKRATALALAADVQLGQADAARDAQALQSLAFAALAFTPAVTVDGTTLLLEVSSCLRYFGGAPRLLAQLRDTLAPLGHRLCIASAPTPLGAALLARWETAPQAPDRAWGAHSTQLAALQALLDEAPVWLLGPGREHWEALQGMGLRRLSDLRQLPRSGLSRRFGTALLDELDRARGTRPDPRVWIAAPPCFESRLELVHRADCADHVLHAAAVLLGRLVAWARSRLARVAAFTLVMHHEPRHRDGDAAPAATALRIELAEPSLDAAHLQLLLRERLAKVSLPAPTLELRIDCRDIVHASAPNGELFPLRHAGHGGLVRLLEHLRARLGDERVRRIERVADHRPERATRSIAALAPPPRAAEGGPAAAMRNPAATSRRSAAAPRSTAAAPRSTAATSRGAAAAPPNTAAASPNTAAASPNTAALPLVHPVWLLPAPQPLAERDALPLLDGAALQLLAGPERIETGWWDGAPAMRDYYIALARDASLVWVYRDRLAASDDAARSAWFLHGRFG